MLQAWEYVVLNRPVTDVQNSCRSVAAGSSIAESVTAGSSAAESVTARDSTAGNMIDSLANHVTDCVEAKGM